MQAWLLPHQQALERQALKLLLFELQTVLFELAILRILAAGGSAAAGLTVYLAPTKALCHERFRDWSARFKKYGVSCVEATSDCEQLLEIPTSCILVTTPEKFDATTRSQGFAEKTSPRLRLIMIDEIHTIGEARGAVLEAVISRCKFFAMQRSMPMRVMALSATVSNLDNLKGWLCTSGQTAVAIKFEDTERPVPLHRQVLGFPSHGMNPFQFENSLTIHIPKIIEKHAEHKPCLVFCSTRKSAESTAAALAKLLPRVSTPRQDSFADPRLCDLVSQGIAFHNAGLPFEDRRTIEFLFSTGKLRVLCATSTLAVGINLPAHLVVIKGTQQYTQNGYAEYHATDIEQMVGRAGRPQFDSFGVAFILTTEAQRAKYQVQGRGEQMLESRYSKNKIFSI